MEMVPIEVGAASRAWDQQHLDLKAGAGQVGDAPTGGFTPGVVAAAVAFTQAWEAHLTTSATACEARADGLRTTIADWLETDRATGVEALLLQAFLEEVR